jgi:two-component system, chemotaxis family, protein-glutamate methylesterase/glutaminase
LAKRLDSLSKVKVCEAGEHENLKPGNVYIAPAGRQMTLFGSDPNVWIALSDNPDDTMHKPSVDVTMCSVAHIFGRHVLGLILTGMGNDGIKGMQAIKHAGGITIGQDEASCAVYGMPRCCAENGLLQQVVSLDEVPDAIVDALSYEL